MLVWVASYPRSGNTLALLALRDVFGIVRLGTVHRDHLGLDGLPHLPPNETRPPYVIPPELATLRNEELLAAIDERPEPFFVKTHRPSDASDRAVALHIVRDGRDALVSQAHRVHQVGAAEFRDTTFDQRLASLIDSGRRGHGDWSSHVRVWRDREAPTAMVRFEDLVVDPSGAVGSACRGLGVTMPEARGEVTSFDTARLHSPVEFRKGEVGSWREEMSRPLEALFWDRHGDVMEALGYQR